ncbi:MAG: hypothetical protein JOZ54_19145 [Acidobacteria bacterium]|nr:hypothetical protein [Acidobacteriota bacterium]
MPGTWNYWVQAPGLVSSQRLAAHIAAADPHPLAAMPVELLPSAFLDLSAAAPALQEGESFALYIENAGRRSLPSAHPVAGDLAHVAVPAAPLRLIVLIERLGAIVWAGHPLSVEAGRTTKAQVSRSKSGTVVALINIDPTVPPEQREAMDGTSSPLLRLIDAKTGRRLAPTLPLREAPFFDQSLGLFENVPAGEYALQLAGDGWRGDSVPLSVRADDRTLLRSLSTRIQTHIDVTWRVGDDIRNAAARTCSGETSEDATRLTVSRCRYGFDRSTPKDCKAIRTVALGRAASGKMSIEDLPPGDYDLVLFRNGARATERVALRDNATASLALDPPVVTGSIRRDGKPLSATIAFATGITVSLPETGEYRCFVSQPPGRRAIYVTPCDTHKMYVEIPHDEVGARYDVVIPENQLVIQVVDAAGGAALSGAAVTNRVITPDHSVSSTDLGLTGDDGTVADESLSTDAAFEVCARLAGYESACRSDIRMSADVERVTLALSRSRGRRVVVLGAVHEARIFAAIGPKVLAVAGVQDDGTATLPASVPAGAMLYLVAFDYPLTRFPMSAEDGEILLPTVTATPISVMLPAASPHGGGPIGLELDGEVVPSEVFFSHQALHNLPVQIRSGETIALAPIAPNQRAALLLWRWSKDMPRDLAAADPFANPAALQQMYRQSLTGANVVLTPDR